MISYIRIILLIPFILSFPQSNSYKVYDDTEVAEIRITMDAADLQYMYDNVQSDSIHVCSVHFKNAVINDTVDNVGIRLRGNTSRLSQKKSFKLSFNSFNTDKKFYSLEKINLNGEHNDPSIARSKISWDLFNKLGIVSARASYAAVYINDDYYGLYLSVEHIDENFVKKNFSDDSGNLWKCLYGADLNYINNSGNSYKISGSGGRVYDLKTNRKTDDYSKLAELIDFLNNSDDVTFKSQLPQKFDLLNLLQVFAINVVTGMWDDYWGNKNNYYLYHEPTLDKFYIIPYDYDNTFGINWFSIDWSLVNPYTFGKINGGYRPLIERTLNVPEFRNLYSRIFNFISENIDSTSLSNFNIYLIQSLIRPWAESDVYRMMDYGFTNDDFNSSFFGENYSFDYHVNYSIQKFIDNRFESLNSQLNYRNADPLIYNYEIYPRYLTGNDTISVNCFGFSNDGIKELSIELYNFNDNSTSIYPLSFNQKSESMDLRDHDYWTTSISDLPNTFSGTAQFIIEDNNGISVRYPTEKVHIRSAGDETKEVLISELMSSNTSTIADNADEFDDWLEIFNPQDTTVTLSGKYLTDKLDNLRKWQFPENVKIEPGQHILIWCDEDQDQSGPHINFKLSSKGEFVAIVDSDGITIVDSVTIPALNEDEVYARENNIGSWIKTNISTPGASNIITDINEVPTKFKNLLTSYPNPFNPSTTIEYELSESMNVEFKVFDILGREVWKTKQEFKESGKHKFNWHGDNKFGGELSSGVYLLSLNGDNFSKAIKLMLVR